MITLLLSLVVASAPADVLAELDKLAGTWTNSIGAELILKDDSARVVLNGTVEFDGKVDVDPKAGKLRLHKGGETWIEARYRLAGDALTLTIDGKDTAYKRRK